MKSIMPVKNQIPKKDATDQSRLRDILFFLLVLFYKFNRIVIHVLIICIYMPSVISCIGNELNPFLHKSVPLILDSICSFSRVLPALYCFGYMLIYPFNTTESPSDKISAIVSKKAVKHISTVYFGMFIPSSAIFSAILLTTPGLIIF